MENKQRIIQELVPGKQITLAHIIANPDPILYQKLGLNPAVEYAKAAIGVLTVSPAETAIIMADIGIKRHQIAELRRRIPEAVAHTLEFAVLRLRNDCLDGRHRLYLLRRSRVFIGRSLIALLKTQHLVLLVCKPVCKL